MASVMYNIAKGQDGSIDWDTHDIRTRLCMVNTTADTEIDADTVGGITTLDETDDGSYTKQALANETVTIDDTDDQAEHSSDDVSWTLAGDGTRDIQGMLIVKHVDAGTGDIPICFVEFSAQPIAKETTSLTMACPATGWFKNS